MRILAVGLICFALFCNVFCTPTVVQITGGKLRGDWSKDDGVTRFLGVPYASSPVGKLRFSPPQEMASWSGEMDTNTIKPECPQDVNMLKATQAGMTNTWNISFELPKFDEDCLYLNVYVPGEVNTNNTLPVIVHFQDGGFQTGLVHVYDGSRLAQVGNVIVVTFAARLGALGYYGEHNLGLHDQLHVLKWVQKNIANFGGDADKVTIFGAGSGGFSVGVHVKSAESKGLFKRAISQGSTILDINFFNSHPDVVTEEFNKAVGCEQKDTNLQMQCLRSLTVDQILMAQTNLTSRGHVFMPTKDGQIIPTSPAKLAMQMPNDVEYMTGVNSNGGTAGIYDFFDRLQTGATEEYFQAFLYGAATVGFTSNPEVARQAIAYEYTPSGDNTDNMHLFKAILHLMRDAYVSQVRGAQLMHAAFGFDVYAYYFDEAVPVVSGVPADLVGATAGSEDFFLFGYIDNDFSRRLMKLWASFADSGSPSLELADGSTIAWPKFTATDKKIAVLRADTTKMTAVIDSLPSDMEKKITFWSDLLPKLIGDSDKCEPTKKPPVKLDEDPIVKLKQGSVQGKRRVTFDNHFEYEEFLDIPYAAPPVGDLRFRPPQPHQGWSGVLKRTRETTGVKMCVQTVNPVLPLAPHEKMDEDCLTLDIYVPYGVSYVRYRKLPVMFWIHGGGYALGSKNFYNGAGLIQRDVIVVMINYRLNVFGFLATGDKAATGNYGLMDQHFALKWVKENIGHFGGDPDEVTIFGQSAGSGSVMFQVVAPDNKGLFKRAIAQSGSLFGPWSLRTSQQAAVMTEKLASLQNCSSSSTHMMVNCLRKIDATTLADTATYNIVEGLPVVDGVFIPRNIEDLYAEKVAENITVMMGRTMHEGYSFSDPSYANISYLGPLKISPSVSKAVKFYYSDYYEGLERHPTAVKTRMLGTDMMTDFFFGYTIEKEANLHVSNGGRLYRYVFNHHTPANLLNEKTPDYIMGIHGDDLVYMFGIPCVNISEFFTASWSPADITLCHAMMDIWANFASTGNPMKGRRDFSAEWPPYTTDSPKIFNLNANVSSASGDELLLTPNDNPDIFRPSKMPFWNDLVPVLVENDAPKPCNETTTPVP